VSGLGRKEFNSGDILLASEVQGYLQDQAVMVFDTAAARGSAIPTPTEGMVTFRKDDDVVEVFDGTDFVPVGAAFSLITATGGTITDITVGGIDFKLHTFNSSGTFEITDGFDEVSVLAVGGGGGGGNYASTAFLTGSGGGGGGGLTQGTILAGIGSYTVTIGAGGLSTKPASQGNDSTINFDFPVVSVGGGEGSASNLTSSRFGGSGGGGGSYTASLAGGRGVSLQGNSGGTGFGSGTGAARTGGGGGGAGAAGANGASSVGGNGGAGLDVSAFFGQSAGTTHLAGGGGGNKCASGATAGTGGVGGGGDGIFDGAAGSGTANTGGGGGGSRNGTSGGAGGSGVVFIKYKR
jgi:hypothetical protein